MIALQIANITQHPIVVAWIVTLVVELLVLYLLGFRNKKLFIVLIAINCLTNPLMNFILQYTPVAYDTLILIALEILVVILEGLVYFMILHNMKQAFGISFACNAASLLLGLAMIPLLY